MLTRRFIRCNLFIQMKRGIAAKYMCGHNIILAHAKTVELYRKKYKPTQNGRVSIALDGKWGYPKDPNNKAGETWQAPHVTYGTYRGFIEEMLPE